MCWLLQEILAKFYHNRPYFFSDKFNRRCGVTKTILPPTIKQEPLEVTMIIFLDSNHVTNI